MPDPTLRVLAVDDDQDLCAVTKDMLETFHSLRVDTVFSADQARDALARQDYDAIVSDYQMPSEDGISFLKKLRGDGDSIPFILFTGRGREEVVIEAINSGADAYVQKGAESRSTFAELGQRIRQAVDRRRAEAALRESEGRYRSLIDGSSVGIMMTDAQRAYIYSNQSWLRMTGRSEEESLGKRWLEGIPPEDRVFFNENWRRSVETGGEHSFEYRYARPDGEMVWVWGNVAPLRDAEGAVTGYLSTWVDITERKRIEETLLEKERTIAKAADLTKMGYWMWKSEVGIITTSDGLCHLLGIPVGSTLSHDMFFDMIHPDDRKMVIASLGEALKGKGDLKIEHRMTRSDGTVITVRDTIEVTTVRGNRPVFILGMVQDISELSRVSETLRETESLFRQAFETIAEGVVVEDLSGNIVVTNSEARRILRYDPEQQGVRGDNDWQMVREDGSACPLAELPSRITATTGMPLSNQIRGLVLPGAQIMWLSINARPLMSKGKSGPYSVVVSFADITTRKQVEDALAEANRKLALLSSITRHDILNQLQVFTSCLEIIDSGGANRESLHQRMRRTARNIDALIRFTADYEKLGSREPSFINVRKMLADIADHVTLGELKVRNELEELEVLADPLLNKVFYNLAENTARHGQTATFIRFSSTSADGYLRLICEDDGKGIPENKKEIVFEKGKGSNFGLGLFFSREILSITGITIHEEGKPGKGARFVITVPPGKWRHAL